MRKTLAILLLVWGLSSPFWSSVDGLVKDFEVVEWKKGDTKQYHLLLNKNLNGFGFASGGFFFGRIQARFPPADPSEGFAAFTSKSSFSYIFIHRTMFQFQQPQTLFIPLPERHVVGNVRPRRLSTGPPLFGPQSFTHPNIHGPNRIQPHSNLRQSIRPGNTELRQRSNHRQTVRRTCQPRRPTTGDSTGALDIHFLSPDLRLLCSILFLVYRVLHQLQVRLQTPFPPREFGRL